MRLKVLSLLSVALLAGCPDRTISELTPDQIGQVSKDIPVSADIDILFVIDNSGSTADKQAVFSANFPRFVQALDAFGTGRPNVHIGVVTTTIDIGVPGFGPSCPHPANADNGLLQNTPRVAGCSPPRDRYISDVQLPTGAREINYTGTLAETLSCIAEVGTGGCGFESPLEAMKRALALDDEGRLVRPENAGFLRPGAFLAVVILTDEDDASVKNPAIFSLPPAQAGPGDFRGQPLQAYQCDQQISATAGGNYTHCGVRTNSYLSDPGSYYEFLSALKPPGKTVVALIGGDPVSEIRTGRIDTPFVQDLALLPSCMATLNGKLSVGRPAIRLMDFVSRFADQGLFRTVCQPDYSQTLADVGQLLFKAVSPCLEGSLDTADIDPGNPGTQLDCTVSDIQNPGTGSEIETPLPECRMADAAMPAPAGQSCYWIKSNPAACSTTTGLEIDFVRTSPPAPGTSVRVSCATRGIR